jgi:two-component system sensor histidine kinase KdpD
VSVANTGQAIPSDEIKKIFERFYRIESGQSPRLPGTGLGLAICRGIIEAHGGRISARSIKGETIFLFNLPLTSPTSQGASGISVPLERAS